MRHTHAYSSQEVTESVTRVLSHVSLLCNIDESPVLVTTGAAGACTHLKALLTLKFKNPLDTAILQSLLSSCIAAETASPRGFDTCARIISHNHSIARAGGTSFEFDASLRDAIAAGVRHPTDVDVAWVADTFLRGDVAPMKGLFASIIECAGLSGTVMIDKSHSPKETVELVCGYTFNVQSKFGTPCKLNRPRVLVIDGFVESVGEINMLLEECSQTKEPCLLYVRGAADDVLSTLSVNFTRGSLRVLPFVVPMDVDHINVLKDIAIASGCDVVSSMKGELISNVSLHNGAIVDAAYVYRDKVTIVNGASERAVATHLELLRHKKADAPHDSLASLYDARIKSLTPRHVIVRLRDDLEFIRRSQALDYALRGVKALRDNGTIEWDTPISSGKQLVSTCFAGVKNAASFNDVIASLGAAVV